MISSIQTILGGEGPRTVCRGRRAVGGAVWSEEPAVVGAGRGSRGRGHPESERRKQSSRADIEGAQTSENLNEMRAMQAVSQVIDSANVRNYGEPQADLSKLFHQLLGKTCSSRSTRPAIVYLWPCFSPPPIGNQPWRYERPGWIMRFKVVIEHFQADRAGVALSAQRLEDGV